MKTKKQKSAPKTPPDFLPACRKAGKASQFHFLRIIKKAVGCEDAEAERLFSEAVSAGKIEEAGRNLAGDVIFYEAG